MHCNLYQIALSQQVNNKECNEMLLRYRLYPYKTGQ